MHRSGVDGKENNEDNESEDSCEDEGVHGHHYLFFLNCMLLFY